ncbi:MAG: ATP-cone domain protein [Parcubacteria group bacterium GW2011_GWA1_40_21]|nr:MAG: ATP-cone domain protein [Parcubacteria group bacterium GW2011_GWA1_40_21]
MPKKDALIIKSTGEKELFDVRKLEASLARAGASESSVSLIAEHILKEVRDGMSTGEIYTHAFSLLRRYEKPAALKYSVRRAVMELGPSGFPFEKFIADLFKARGFKAETNLLARGKCVEHEIDVMAWNDVKLIIAEAKFHNDNGLKSDLKVALYVKARFDDLKETLFSPDGNKRKFDEAYLITNTKFTSHAIDYAKCSGLALIGWNYPNTGNLHNMIEDFNLHPITALTALSGSEKRDLLSQGIVLSKQISDRNILKGVGIKDARIDAILQEIKELF